MDRLKYLTDAFKSLSELHDFYFDAMEDLTIVFYIKRLLVLASRLYPKEFANEAPNVYYIGRHGQIWSGSSEVDLEEDILPQFMATQSYAIDYLLIYYRKSPYWELHFECLNFDGLCREEEMSLPEFFKRRTKIFEEKLISSFIDGEDDHPLNTYYELFEADEYASDDCVLLVSKLMPYYKRVEAKICKKERKLCKQILCCEQALTRWLSGYSYSICSEQYDKAYYISCDSSSDWYDGSYGAGVLDHNLNILVAGEIIDKCILKLDKKYSFLPDDIKSLGCLERGGCV